MKNYQEATRIYVAEHSIGEDKVKEVNISVGLSGQEGIETILADIKDDYKEEVIIQSNIMYYKSNDSEESQKKIEWCKKHNIPVWGDSESGGDKVEDKIPEKSNYKKIGNVYMNTPDLSHLNPQSTYYITYDENGENPSIYGRIDRVDTPSNWYDYSAKKYANIVTVNDNEVAYWVWIPRYAYIADGGKQEVDVRFLTVDNEYKDVDGNTESLPENFKISDAFSFGNTNLPGYWISKYEVSEVVGEDVTINDKTVSTTKATSTDSYQVYLDGNLEYTGAFPHEIEKLRDGKEHDVCVVKAGGIMLGRHKARTTDVTIKVDTSKLDPNNTYYVYWDENGVEHNDIPISQPAPENWYNYAEKKWANIVTKAHGTMSYWVWIPRYEYKLNNNTQFVETHFITTDVTQGSNGYQIPDAFTFNKIPLSGYWISKYEVSEP